MKNPEDKCGDQDDIATIPAMMPPINAPSNIDGADADILELVSTMVELILIAVEFSTVEEVGSVAVDG